MLQSAIGEARPGSEIANAMAIAMTRTEQLHRVGGECARAIEAAVHHPRVLAVLSEILAAHDDGSAARMAGDVVINVLRRVRLVVGDEGAGAESQVLHEDGIDRRGNVARIRRLDVP